MKREFRRIKGHSKEVIGTKWYKRVTKIKDKDERTESLKYLVASKLKDKLLDIELKIGKNRGKEALLLESKLTLLRAKIKVFESTHSKRDFLVVKNLIAEIEEGL